LNGESVEYDEPAAATPTKTVAKAAPTKTVEEVPEDEDEDDDDAEAQRILAQLQARRKQSAG
jgi:hypothetical protein